MADFQEIINSDELVLVDFFADWCGPCKMLSPILDQVKSEMGDKVKIVKIDVDRNQKLAAELMIQGVPTMLIFKNGEQVWRESGVLQTQELIQILEKQLE